MAVITPIIAPNSAFRESKSTISYQCIKTVITLPDLYFDDSIKFWTWFGLEVRIYEPIL